MIINPYINPLKQLSSSPNLNQHRSNISSSSPSSSYSSSSSASSSYNHNNNLDLNSLKSVVAQPLKSESNDLDENQSKLVIANKLTKLLANNESDQKHEQQQVKCDQCAKIFYNNEFLALHKLNKHNPLKQQLLTVQNNQREMIIDHTETNVKSPSSSHPASSTTPNMLFNESFCEYCNKSFCNKYFLRTHMHKAHGKNLIIENINNGNNNNNNLMMNNLLTNKQINNEEQSYHNSSDFESNYNNEEENNLNETNFAKAVDRVICEICNKQVCNKYFLRTHKQKVHGIFDSNMTSTNQAEKEINENEDNNNFYEAQNNNDENNLMIIDGDDEDGEIEEGETRVKNDSINNNEKELGEFFRVNETLNNNQQQQHQLRERRNSSTSNLSILTASSCKSNNNNKENSLKTSPPPIQSQTDLLKRLISNNNSQHHQPKINTHSIITNNLANKIFFNRNSFCNLCRRQFYSKCFLKNHLLRIHGIKLEDDDMSESDITRNKIFINKLNFKNNAANQLLKKSIHKKKYNNFFMSMIEQDTKQKHLYNSNYNNSGTSRVNCNICNKELCNKYFLKQHVNNSHKISFNDYLIKYEHDNGNDLLDDENSSVLAKKLLNNQDLFYNNSSNNNNEIGQTISNSHDSQSISTACKLNINRDHVPRLSKFKRYFLIRKNKKIIVKSLKKHKKTIKDNEEVNEIEMRNNINNNNNNNNDNSSNNPSIENQQVVTSVNPRKRLHSGNSLVSSSSSSSSFSSSASAKQKKSSPNFDIDNAYKRLYDNLDDLQPFLIESNEHESNENEELFKNHFMPCLIYLPCKSKNLSETISVRIKLKPISKDDQTVYLNTATNSNKTTSNNSDQIEIKHEKIHHDDKQERAC